MKIKTRFARHDVQSKFETICFYESRHGCCWFVSWELWAFATTRTTIERRILKYFWTVTLLSMKHCCIAKTYFEVGCVVVLLEIFVVTVFGG